MTLHESQQILRETLTADLAAGGKVCPVCYRETLDEFVPLLVLDDDLQGLIHANAPDTQEFRAVCSRCVRLFERAKEHIIQDAAVQKDGSHVLSTPLRLDADDRFTGRGVTTYYPAGASFAFVKDKLDRGAAAVAYSYRATTRTPNWFGIVGDTSYVVRRLFTDGHGRQWVELYNPTGSDVGNGKLMDYSPGAVQQNDGIITIAWADFQRSSNFSTLYVA